MSTTAPTKRLTRPNSVPSGEGLAGWFTPFLATTVGSKYLVAVTGIVLTGFVIAHMLGNLQVFLGPQALNDYAHFLKEHSSLLWTARTVLLICFVLHIVLAIRLNLKAQKARPVRYAYEQTVQASWASRHMVLTGVVVLLFTLYHLAHYTLGIVNTATLPSGEVVNYLDLRDNIGRPDVYSMVIYGFRNPITSILYIAAQVFLFLHLVHGVGSVFQTLGLNSPRAARLIRGLSWAVALLVCLGNIGIVAVVWAGALEPLTQTRAVPQNPKN